MPVDPVSLGMSVTAVLIALIATSFTIRAFRLKSGLSLRGSYSTTSSISCDDKYISSVTVENLKDRSVVIFKIFLRVGQSYYIELEDFEEEPFVLRPFEVLHREYEPIDHYSTGTKRVSLNELLEAKNVRRRLVLSTSSGRYVIKRWVDRWDPLHLLFKNHLTGIIQPIRSTFDGKAYGSNAKFVVTVTMSDGRKEVIPIHGSSHRFKVFRGFYLTEESLRSRDALEEFLLERAIAGDLSCADLSVFDLEAWRNQAYRDSNDVIELKRPIGWITYHLMGRVFTWWRERMRRRENRARQKKRLARLRQNQPGRESPQLPTESAEHNTL
jgi:hypothetical protein